MVRKKSNETKRFLARYDASSMRCAAQIIEAYSTSFSLATKLLRGHVKQDVRNLYAVVRIADEIVDGTAAEADVPIEHIAAMLDHFEEQILAAPGSRFHTDPILHAYAITARRCKFNPEHIKAFFYSMRQDIHQQEYRGTDIDRYIYGSAEVIGLLCLSIFLVGHPVTEGERQELEHGARSLGAAFQKINFLRDFAEDSNILGRSYVPGATHGALTEEAKDRYIADIRDDLRAARAVIDLLPRSARYGVIAAANLFQELTDAIERIPAEELSHTRVSVPPLRKAVVMSRGLKNQRPA